MAKKKSFMRLRIEKKSHLSCSSFTFQYKKVKCLHKNHSSLSLSLSLSFPLSALFLSAPFSLSLSLSVFPSFSFTDHLFSSQSLLTHFFLFLFLSFTQPPLPSISFFLSFSVFPSFSLTVFLIYLSLLSYLSFTNCLFFFMTLIPIVFIFIVFYLNCLTLLH